MEIIFAVLLGALFGFVLQRVGAADPDKIIGMLTLKDTHLIKAILMGIGSSSALLFAGIILGLIDPGHMSIKVLNWGVIVGGITLGFGWALSGFCPGTGVVAVGSRRKDALFFVLGGLVGAGLFALMYGSLKETFLFDEIFSGRMTLVATQSSSALIDASWSPFLAIALALGLIAIARHLPHNMR